VRRSAAGALAVGCILAVSPVASAALDPQRAQADVQDATREQSFPFCSAPHEPLSRRALALCAHAGEIPGCDGFAAACAKGRETPEQRPALSGPWATIGGILNVLAQAVVWIVVLALLLAVIVPIVRALRGRRVETKRAPEPRATAVAAPVEADAPLASDEEELLRRAAELAARGENAAALELYLAASLRALSKRGALRLAPHRTNGEYVRACSDAIARPALRDIVRDVDRVKFGAAPAGAGILEAAGRRAFAIVRGLPIALLLASLALCAGCEGYADKARRPGDDPAGLELLGELLRREGARVEPLATSLASLPLTGPDAAAPAVIVDVERTPLDEDTAGHVVAWVEAGGRLVLAGDPARWPAAFGASPAATGAHRVTVRALVSRGADDGDDDGDSEASTPEYAADEQHAELAEGAAVTFRDAAERAAWFDDQTQYAGGLVRGAGRGYVFGVATDELLTNAGLARPGNAAAAVALFSHAGRMSFAIADPDDGVAPPSTPLAAMLRAGLGPGLLHAFVACVVLFLAAGVRLARPKPAPPPLRRAFAEHVDAVGALYARTRSAAHALAAYAQFADERLRERLSRQPSQGGNVAAFLAARAGVPLERSQRVWARAVEARGGGPPQGDELAVLAELRAMVSAVMAKDT